MRNFLFKYFVVFFKEYIFIFLTATVFLLSNYSQSYSEENVFTVDEVKVEGVLDLKFSRDKYLNKAFSDSFEILMRKILLTKDLKIIKDIKLTQVRNLISSFHILEESYKKKQYILKVKIIYNEMEVKKLLGKRNISFSQPENISVVFYPVLFINDEMQSFNENFFYKNWNVIKIKNEIISFILPLEDLDDVSKIIEMKDKVQDLNVEYLISKYDIKNYTFALMDYSDNKLNIYLKTSFNNNKISKNYFYEINEINNESKLSYILKDLKIKITDLWKQENLVNLLMPLSINLKFNHSDLNNLEKLRNILYQISIIDHYTLEELNVNNSFFKIYYYGNPKKLSSELLKFGYKLDNSLGFWQIYLNE